MGTVDTIGTRAARFAPSSVRDPAFRAALAERLAELDETLLAAYVDDTAVAYPRLHDSSLEQTQRGELHPVFFGAAITGRRRRAIDGRHRPAFASGAGRS